MSCFRGLVKLSTKMTYLREFAKLSGMKAIYPGTFDPITLGHVNLVERAAKQCESLIVAVAESEGKSPSLSLKQRVELVKASVAHLDRVDVVSFNGLLVDLAKAHQATAIIRGLRTAADLAYETQLAYMNHVQHPGLETIFLTPNPQFAHIAASLVREIAAMGGDITAFVSAPVAKALSRD